MNVLKGAGSSLTHSPLNHCVLDEPAVLPLSGFKSNFFFTFTFPSSSSFNFPVLVECKVEMKHCASIMPWDPLFLLSEAFHREEVDFNLLVVKISLVTE